MATLVEETRERFRARMQELQPAIDEYRQLEEALAALEGKRSAAPPLRERARARPTTSTTPSGRAPRGQRREQVADLLRKNPDLGPSAVARELGIGASQASNLLKRVRDEDA